MTTFRTQLREYAQDQYGYVTTRDAQDLGIPGVELRKLAQRGALQKVGFGLYRVPDMRPTDLDQFAEAVFLVGADAYLTHDAVLAMHHLALVNPPQIRVGTPHRVRAALPKFVKVIQQRLPDEDITAYEGIRSATVARALLDCRGLVMDERLDHAVNQAQLEGFLTTEEAARIHQALQRPATGG